MNLNKTEKILFIKSAMLIVVVIATYFTFSGYAINQGFNPSDEGVVLSQSWRLLNNEVPHKDFISIRPVGSGFIHQLDHILPYPLITTSRIIAAMEYVFISIAWAFLLISVCNRYIAENIKKIVYPSVILVTVIFNLNNGPIFTWTTTDALLLTTIGLIFIYSFLYSKTQGNKWLNQALPAIVLCMCAALCRQTFALPAVLTSALFLFNKSHKISAPYRLLWLIAGSAPILFYFFYLLSYQALGAFFMQMSGRTELFETGFITYVKS
ncbi:MAG: hypothetical protein ACK4IY_09835, partial [Chitinophagales bacterium]